MLGTRIVTALVLGVAVTATIWFLPTPQAMGMLGLLWIAGAWEWAGLAQLRSLGRLLYTAGIALVMLAAALAPTAAAGVDLLLVVALLAWSVALAGVLAYPRRIPLVWVALAGPIALVPSWLLLAVTHATQPRGPQLTVLALALVWAADVGAYAVGRLFGRTKLAPRVSPGKTWEGVAGGVALTLLVAWLGGRWIGLAPWPLLAIALCAGLVSVVGDLTVSMLKRNVGLKDSGRLLPGHGGVMDRIDGLIAAVPAFVAGLRMAGLDG